VTAPRQASWGEQGRRCPDGTVRVLVTGAGGPAAIAAMKSLRAEESVELIAADMDPWASGLYLVPAGARTLIPAGAAADFTDVVLTPCLTLGVQVVIPTVDAELRPLARAREAFTAAGIGLLLAPAAALDVILDKLAQAILDTHGVPEPRFDIMEKPFTKAALLGRVRRAITRNHPEAT
jgi:carbamoyl-phosphate synthase large subunit